MPTIDITRPELIWPGKYDEKGNRVENRGTALPFQVSATIREGRQDLFFKSVQEQTVKQ